MVTTNCLNSQNDNCDVEQITCFILIPFSEPFTRYYKEIIKPAVEQIDAVPLRGDSLFRPSPIVDDIWQMIQDANVVVAEMTGRNPNVFYELGLAHAIGKPVILISETISDVPFDLQSLRVILYNKDDPAWGATLRESLVASLRETLRNTRAAVPPMFRKRVISQAPEDTEISVRLSAIEAAVSRLVLRPLSFDLPSPDVLAVLTPRQLQVLDLVGVGLPTREIAVQLNLSTRTVEIYKARIKEKLGLDNYADMIVFARRASVALTQSGNNLGQGSDCET